MNLHFYEIPILSDLLDFIKINGKNLKTLNIYGTSSDMEFLGELIQLIGEKCQKLEHLETLYSNDIVDQQQLIELFDGCKNLNYIIFPSLPCSMLLNSNKIFEALNQTLPEKLNTIIFNCKVEISDKLFDDLMNNWKGPKPFRIIEFSSFKTKLPSQVKKYKDLGFLM